MDSYQIIGFVAGAIIVVNTVPQLVKTLKTKEVDDLSLGMFSLVFLAQILWLIYGLHLNNLPLILTNGLGSLAVVTNIVFILKYRTVPQKQ